MWRRGKPKFFWGWMKEKEVGALWICGEEWSGIWEWGKRSYECRKNRERLWDRRKNNCRNEKYLRWCVGFIILYVLEGCYRDFLSYKCPSLFLFQSPDVLFSSHHTISAFSFLCKWLGLLLIIDFPLKCNSSRCTHQISWPLGQAWPIMYSIKLV